MLLVLLVGWIVLLVLGWVSSYLIFLGGDKKQNTNRADGVKNDSVGVQSS